jgi:hypothetical protein
MLGHELHRGGSFWSFLLSVEGPGRFESSKRMFMRWPPPLRQLPAGTAGWA